MTKCPRAILLLATLCIAPATGCYVEAHPVAGDEPVYEGEPPPPPAAEVEVVPAAPGPEFVWVGGYHRWNGRQYVWVRGRYERRPHARAHWVPAHWVARGRGHVWVEGRWE
jgi:hypothetical protein